MKLSHAIGLLCVVFLTSGCIGRSTSFLEYYPPESSPSPQSDYSGSILVKGSQKSVKTTLLKHMNSIGFAHIPGEGDANSLTFSGSLPESLEKSPLDCGLLSIYSPDAAKAPSVFPAVTPRDFPMADGTSVPKPARLDPTTKATVHIVISPEGTARTRIELRTKFHVDLALHRYVMVSGFSPMAPERLSKLTTERIQISFASGEIGRSEVPLPDFRYQIRGLWPVQCVSTGAFERWVLDEVRKTFQ